MRSFLAKLLPKKNAEFLKVNAKVTF